jgi:hypothetical protein
VTIYLTQNALQENIDESCITWEEEARVDCGLMAIVLLVLFLNVFAPAAVTYWYYRRLKERSNKEGDFG